MRIQSLFAAAVVATFLAHATEASAHGGGGDIALFNTNGQADVGFAVLDDDDINQESFDPTDSVFQAVLTPINRTPFLPYDFGSSEPGYDANEAVAVLPGQIGSGLPSSAMVSWQTRGIWQWDGTDFQPTSGIAGGYGSPMSGTTDSAGGFHLHPTFGLGRDDLDPVADGVYLAELAVEIEGLATSDSFWLVSLVDSAVNSAPSDTEAEELAVEIGASVRAYMAGDTADAMAGGRDYTFYGQAIQYAEALAVPEPSAVMLIAAPLLLGAARRR